MVKYILRHGMAADKLVLGIPLFGRSYTLSETSVTSPGAGISGWGEEGTYTQTKGMLAYFEVGPKLCIPFFVLKFISGKLKCVIVFLYIFFRSAWRNVKEKEKVF